MANESRVRANFVAGALSASLTSTGTSMSSAALADLPAIGATEHAAISLFTADGDGRITAKEVVYVTAHTASATTATIARGKEGTTGVAWASGDKWEHAPTALDYPTLLHVRDEKATSTAGGTFTSGAWQTRDLNTIKTNELGVTLVTNVITGLPAGTYEATASAPAYGVGQHQLRLYDVTGAAALVSGSSEFSTANTTTNRSLLQGRFSLAATSDLRLEHRCAQTITTQGYGVATGFGAVEVYTDLQIHKVG